MFKSISVIALASTCYTTAIEATQRPTTIHSLQYGNALYHFYQKNYFSSISELLVAKKARPITNQGDDPELLLGGLYLYYGLHDNAMDIFNSLLDEKSASKQVQDKAWFNIGKMQYLSHHYDKSIESLSRIGENLSKDRDAERYNILANIYLKKSDYETALKQLENITSQADWKAYTEYNIGVSYIRNQNYDAGVKLLNNITELKTEDNELKSLRDKTNIALGYSHIQNSQSQLAIQNLGNVRLEGPLSAKALLGIGWARQQQNKLEEALVPWLELQKRHTLDTSVQESLIAVPYTLEKLNKPQLALQFYKQALQNYKIELANINNIIGHIKNGQLVNLLRPARVQESIDIPEYIRKSNNPISSPYLIHILDSREFQQAHKNYIELNYLRHKLQHWKKQVPAFRLMLEERKKRYNSKFQTTKNDSRLKLINKLKKQRDALASHVLQIESKQAVFKLTTDEEAATHQRLKRIKKNLDKLKSHQDIAEELEKYNLLYGLFYWNLATDYAPRKWQVKKQLNELNYEIEKSESLLASLKKSSEKAPQSFRGFNQRIHNKQSNLTSLLNKINRLIDKQEKFIENKALKLLQARYRQIENYHIRASYSLARLYDSLTIGIEDTK